MQRKFILATLIFLLVLPGCAPRINVKKAPPGTTVLPPGEDVLIFGRIRWIENGEERKSCLSQIGLSQLGFGFRVALKVLRAEDMKTGTIEVEKDCRFFTLLPRGSYIIHRLDWSDSWGGNWLVPRVAFQVAEGQHSYYLGTLGVNVKTKRNIFGDSILKGLEIYIEDEESEAMEAFHKRYPHQEVKVAKALMIHDSRIPRIEELENQRILLDILRWLPFGIMTIQ
jgi:hypothetical protein